MIDLRWEGDDKNQYLFAGTNEAELVWLEKRSRHWAAVVWLPGVDRGREYNTLAAHKTNMEAKVRHWFARANGEQPSMATGDRRTKYRGMFCDTFFDVEAPCEAVAQDILKRQLINQICYDPEPFILWENP